MNAFVQKLLRFGRISTVAAKTRMDCNLWARWDKHADVWLLLLEFCTALTLTGNALMVF